MIDTPLLTDRGNDTFEFEAGTEYGRLLYQAGSIWRNLLLNTPRMATLCLRTDNLSIALLAQHFKTRDQTRGYCRYQSYVNEDLIRTIDDVNPLRQRQIDHPLDCFARAHEDLHRVQDFASALTVEPGIETGVRHDNILQGKAERFCLPRSLEVFKNFYTSCYVNHYQMEKVAIAVSVIMETAYSLENNTKLQIVYKVYMAQKAFATICKAIIQHLHDPKKPEWWIASDDLLDLAFHLFFLQPNVILPRILETREQADKALEAVKKLRGVLTTKDMYQSPDGLALYVWQSYQIDVMVYQYQLIVRELCVRFDNQSELLDHASPKLDAARVKIFRDYLVRKVTQYGKRISYADIT
jgi:hypothetical protein